jgi:hypothetical protein
MPFSVKVDLGDTSDSDLENVQLSVSLPSSLVMADGSNMSIINQSLGNISKGSINEQTFQLVPLPSVNSSQTIAITASYSIGSLSAKFQTTSNLNVNVQNLPLTLELTSPSTTFSGEEMESVAAYGWNPASMNMSSSTTLPPLSIQFIYPGTFSLSSSIPSASAANESTWQINPLDPSDPGKIVVRGKVSLPDQTQFNTTANITANILGKNYVILSSSAQTTVNASPLSLDIMVNNSTSTVAQPGETLDYTLNYKNNTQVAFQDIVIQANVSGGMLDWNTLQSSSANFDPNTNTLTWDPENTPGLGSFAPGSSGSVSFNVSLDKSYPINQLNDKDFSASVNATITSPTVPYLITADQTVNTASSITKVGGLVSVQAAGYFRDAVSGLVNSGPWPPQNGTPTEYTIHWDLTNYSTDLNNVQVEAQLPPGVTFTGQSSSNTSSTLQYSSSTNEMIWNVGYLPATSGILTPAPEGIFQISATPQSSDVGQYMNLLGPTSLSAQDSFTNLPLTAGSDAITTLLPSDKTVASGDGIVK